MPPKGNKKKKAAGGPAAATEYKNKGNVAFAAGNFDEAIKQFTLAIGADPDAVYYSNRSACWASMGKWARAVEDAETCIKAKPEWAKGYSRLGLARFALHDIDAAEKAYRTGLALAGDDNSAFVSGLQDVVAAKEAKERKVQQAKDAADAKDRKDAKAKEDALLDSRAVGEYVIGIDLGTTFSCVSVWKDGKVQVLPNSEGKLTTPSWVAFGDDGERLVGDAARTQAILTPKRALFNIKRIIGRQFDECYEDVKRMPYTVKKGKGGKPVIEVEVKGVVQSFAPEQISAMVLEKMKKSAEAALGVTITKAVVTVPAYFNDAQRRLTKDAGTIAGLDVLRIINEPTAAALAYGLDKVAGSLGKANVLVFDLGGGTFDVSLLKIEEGVFQVLATAGDTHLGGEDFDSVLADHLSSEIKKQHEGKDLFSDPQAVRKLRNACENAKRLLSVQKSVDIDLFLCGQEVSIKLTREKFDALLEKTFQRCMKSVKQVLADAKVAKEAVDEIVLVGGSTRVPRVRQILTEYFGGKALCQSVNPDEAVAYGAAVQAAILGGVRDPKTAALVLVDVIPLSLGVECQGKQFAKVVSRNTSVPCTKSSEFTTVVDWQTEVDIRVFEGERGNTDGNHLLGEFTIKGVQRAKKGEAKVVVTFSVNTNGLLTVSAQDKVTGAKADVEIQHDRGRLTGDEIDKMLAEAARFREEDEARAKEMEAKFGAAPVDGDSDDE